VRIFNQFSARILEDLFIEVDRGDWVAQFFFRCRLMPTFHNVNLWLRSNLKQKKETTNNKQTPAMITEY